MAKRAFLTICVLVVAAAGTGAALYWDSIRNIWRVPQELVIRERLIAQWQSMDLMHRSIIERPSPAQWSAGVFLGAKAVSDMLDVLENSKLEYIPSDQLLSGTELTLEQIEIRPESGRVSADLTLSAKKGDLILRLRGAAFVSFQGTERKDDETIYALLRIEPTVVQPAVGFGKFEFKLRDFWARLIPDLAVALADPNLFVTRVPLTDTIKVKLALNQNGDEPIGDGDKGRIRYIATLPESVITRRVTYSTPIITTSGLWIFALLNEKGQEIAKVSDPPTRDVPQLQKAIAALEEQLSTDAKAYSALSAQAVSVRMNKDIWIGLGKDIAALPGEKRRVEVRSTSIEGKLAEKKWRDKFLGEGGAYAELSGSDAVKGSIQFGPPQATWDKERLVLSLPVAVKSESSVHIHFDPLIGGGMGTTIGVKGDGDASFTASAAPKLLNGDGVQAAALQNDLQCSLVGVEVASDGRLKVDIGWAKVPRIGARIQVPLGRDGMAPTPLFDGRPHFVEIPIIEPKQEEQHAKPWRLVPAHRALKVALAPIEARSDADGMAFTADLAISPIPTSGQPDEFQKAKQAVVSEANNYAKKVAEVAAKAKPKKDCDLKPSFAVLLGDIEFGPNNEIVKFIRNAWNDITKGPGPNNELRKLLDQVGILSILPVPPAARDWVRPFLVPTSPVSVLGLPAIRIPIPIPGGGGIPIPIPGGGGIPIPIPGGGGIFRF